MSTVDERIVRMEFDNTGFEAGATKAVDLLGKLEEAINFDGASSGLDAFKNALSRFSTSPLTDSLQTASSGFSMFEQIGIGALRRVGEEVVNLGERLTKGFVNRMTSGARDGFNEYQLQMNSIQTIAANSGEEMDVIKENLNELNEYADKTVYNFSEMTQNIGRFTAAGLDVKTSTQAIKGFANMAALAGAGSQETSRGMYQLSQAMASGVVKLQDWKSIQSASIDTAAFKDILIETARAMDQTETSVDDAIEKTGSFNASLSEGWLTADVMAQALKVATMSTRDFADEEDGMNKRMRELLDMGYSEDVAQKLIGIANAADDSAREVRTWKQLMDAVSEAIGSGWAKTWELIIGDFEEATVLFTTISKELDGIVGAAADSRNALVKVWADAGGRQALIGALANIFEGIVRIVTPIKDAFDDIFGVSGEQLAVLTENFALFTQKLVISEETMASIKSVFLDVFAIGHSVFGVLGNVLRSFVTSIGTVWKNTSKYRDLIASDFGSILSTLASVFNNLHAFSDDAGNIFDVVLYPITILIESILRLAHAFLEAVSGESVFYTVLTSIGTIISSVLSVIGSLFKIVSQVISVLISGGTVAASMLSPLFQLLSSVLSRIAKVSTSVANVFANLSDTIYRVTNKWIRAFKIAADVSKEFGLTLSALVKSIVAVAKESTIFQTISSAFNTIKNAIASLFPSFNGFSNGFTELVIQPLTSLRNWIRDFGTEGGKISKLEYFTAKLREMRDTVGSPFALAFNVANDALSKFINFVKDNFVSGVSQIKEWFASLELKNPFSVVSEWASSINFETLFGTTVPQAFTDALGFLTDQFNKLKASAKDATQKVKNFIAEAKKKHKVDGFGLSSVLNSVKTSFGGLVAYFDNLRKSGKSFGEIVATVFSDIWKKLKEWGNNLKDVFGDIYAIFRGWIHQVAESGQGIGSALAGAADFVFGKIEGIPNLIKTLFGEVKEDATQGATDLGESLSKSGEELKENATNSVKGLFDNLPTIDSITAGLSEFFRGIREKVITGISGIFTKDDAGENKDLKASLADLFDFSGFEIKLPDFLGGFDGIIETFSASLDKFPTEKIDGLIGPGGKVTSWAKTLGTLAYAFTGWKFLGSLTKLNKGLAAEGKGLGDFFSNLPGALSEGMAHLGETFGKLGGQEIGKGLTEVGKGLKGFASDTLTGPNGIFKKSKAKEFLRVAEGLLVLAAALLVLAQVPAEDLSRVGTAMVYMAGGVAGLLLILGLVNKFGSVGFIQECGVAVAAVGVGILALAGSLWILSNIPAEQMDKGVYSIIGLVLAIGLMLSLISKQGSDLKGVAAAIIAIGVTINLLMIPILLMGYLWQKHGDILGNGTFIVGLIAAALLGVVWAMAYIATNGKDIGLASIALVAMSAALILISGVVVLLGMISGPALAGTAIVALLIGCFTGFMYFFSMVATNGKDIAIASIALIALAVAVNLMALPVATLGALGAVAVKGVVAVGILAILLGGAVYLLSMIGDNTGDILAGSLGIVALAAALILITGPVMLLGTFWHIAQNGIAATIVLTAVLVGAIAALSFVASKTDGIVRGTGALIMLSVALGILTVVFGALSAISIVFESGVNMALAELVVFVAALSALAFVGSMVGGGLIQMGLGLMALSAGMVLFGGAMVLMQSIDWPYIFNGLESMWNAFANSTGGNIIIGLVNGILNFIEMIGSVGNQIGSSLIEAVCSVLGIASPSTEMEALGEFSVEGFINGITNWLGNVLGIGSETGENLLDGVDMANLPETLGNKATEAINGFLDSIDVEAIKNKGLEIIDSLRSQIDTEKLKEDGINVVSGFIAGVGENLAAKMEAKASEMFHSFVDPILGFFGIASPSTYMRDTVGANVLQGLIDGLSNGSLLGTLGSIASDIGGGIVNGLAGLPTLLGETGSTAMTWFTDTIGSFIGPVGNKGAEVTNALDSSLKGVDTKARNAGTNAMNSFVVGMNSKLGAISSKAREVVNAVANSFNSLPATMRSKGESAMQAFANGISTASGTVRAAAQGVVNSASNISSQGGWNSFYSIGSYIVQGLEAGMNSRLANVRAIARNMINTAATAARTAAAIASPSKLFMEIGGYVGEGFIIGMKDYIPKASQTGEDLANAVPDAFSDALSNLSLGIDDILDTDYTPEITPILNPTEFNSGLANLSSTFNAGFANLSIGNLNYAGELSAKIDDYNDINRQVVEAMSKNGIDYDLLGVSVANALIRSGVHVEIDGGQLMGYLAGEVSAARRQFSR